MVDTVVSEVNPANQLLRSAVDAIPNHGFDRNSDQRRNALMQKVEAFERQLDRGAIRGARERLENDILLNVERWLVDGYEKSQPLELEKDEILGLIVELLTRLE